MKIKQILHFALACSLMLATASCTDEVVTNNGSGTDSADIPEGMQALTLKVGGISGGSVTKAGGIAKPEEIVVEDMSIYVFKYDPARGDDDSDDANYTLFNCWTYMKNKVAGYTPGDPTLRAFQLGGSGQFRTATIYVPKDAGKVKCFVTTGKGTLISPDGKNTAGIRDKTNNAIILPSGLIYQEPKPGDSPTLSGYSPVDFSQLDAISLAEMKKLVWRDIEKITSVTLSTNDGTATNIPDTYWSTPLSMAGESDMLNIDTQSSNSSQVTATLRRHAVRLDILNNGLQVSKIEFINLPVLTTVVPATEGVTTVDFKDYALGTKYKGRSTDPYEPGNNYTAHTVYQYDSGDYFTALTRYVYPNLMSYSETALYAPFINVTIGTGPGTVYILPLRTKNTDGSYTPVDLKSNHRYTLQLTKKGDNILDYNIVIEEWQAGADFNVELGDGASKEVKDYLPAITKVDYDATNNPTVLDGDKLYVYTAAPELGKNNYTSKWQFKTLGSILSQKGLNDGKVNISASESPDLGYEPSNLAGNGYTVSASNNDITHTVPISTGLAAATRWITVQNPYNTEKAVRVKAEYIYDEFDSSPAQFALSLAQMAETNMTNDAADASIPFTVDSYHTEWPASGTLLSAPATTANNLTESFDLLMPAYFYNSMQETAETIINSMDITQPINITQNASDGSANVIWVSNGNADAPCLIQRIEGTSDDGGSPSLVAAIIMYERIKAPNGTSYLKILVLTATEDTWKENTTTTFNAMRTLIRNVENGLQTNYSYIVRYFPEGDYWIKRNNNNMLVSLRANSLGEITEDTSGKTGYLRLTVSKPEHP